jgi:hypothetical protein
MERAHHARGLVDKNRGDGEEGIIVEEYGRKKWQGVGRVLTPVISDPMTCRTKTVVPTETRQLQSVSTARRYYN